MLKVTTGMGGNQRLTDYGSDAIPSAQRCPVST